MKRTIPLLINSLGGLILIVAFFVPAWQASGEIVTVWFDILASIAFILGGANLFKVHLKAMSDRIPGWGYSAVTLLSFVVTLYFGMVKFGTSPAPSTEYYGETFAKFPVSQLPEYRVTGTLPVRGDGAPLPASVSRQLRVDGPDLVFQGWLEPNQISDLMQYHDTLEWRATVEKLADTAVPPPALRGRVRYLVDHASLACRGYMFGHEEYALKTLLGGSSDKTQLIEDFATRARQPRDVLVSKVPSGFEVPKSFERIVQVSQPNKDQSQVLRINGPMSPALRESIANEWPNWPRTRPLGPPQQETLKQDLAALGSLSTSQQAALETFFKTQDKPLKLKLLINLAGAAPEVTKSATQLLADKNAGVAELQPLVKIGTDQLLNPAQEQLLEELFWDAALNPAAIAEKLRSAGPLSDAQAAAIDGYFAGQPTLGQRNHKLCFELLKSGPLPDKLRQYLLKDYAQEMAWNRDVGRLFVATHDAKYGWSGAYDEPGTPFGWLYEYAMQPLMTTMFALLAFFVASAAFRAFRAKNIDAILLLGTAFIILLRATPVGTWLSGILPDSLAFLKLDNVFRFIMSVFNTAGNRAIMIGIALGIASTSLKVLLGIDRSYLGSDD